MTRTRARRRAKEIRLIFVLSVILIALIGIALFAFRDQSGWSTKGGVTRYLDSKGNPQNGWQKIDGKDYYFGNNGAMVTGWQEIKGQTFYFTAEGVLCYEWLELDGNRYYLGHNGVMTTGWKELDGKRYYFDENGCAATGVVELSGKSYRFNADGSAVIGWYEDETGRYFYNEDGTMQTGWLQWEQKTYYFAENGTVTTGWLTIDEDRYYFFDTGRMAIGEVEIDGISRFFSSKGREVLMCNPWHAIPNDFTLDLVDFEGFQIDRTTKPYLEQMFNDGRAAGAALEVNNSYRSIATQQYKWDRKVAERMAQGMTKEEAERITGQSLAIPGHSEHHTGMALDINSGGGSYEWMAENCWDYGFIVRYPDDHLDITGIIYEPWHFRYVGIELAQELKNYCCMEEYFAELTEQQKNIPD